MKKEISGEATGVWLVRVGDDDRVAGDLKIEDRIAPIPFAHMGRTPLNVVKRIGGE